MGTNIWTFETAEYRVTVDALPEHEAPEDCFEFPEHIDAIHSGELEWFSVRARVEMKKPRVVLGEDYLGGCAYRSISDFRDHFGTAALSRAESEKLGTPVCVGSYFSDMVRTALDDARKTREHIRRKLVA